MKRAIYIILLLLYTTLVHAYMYQSNMPTYQPQTRIGYTTNYGNSFKTTQLAEQPTQMYTTTHQYEGIYTPAAYNNQTLINQPRKAAKAAGGSATYNGVVVTYTVEADYLGIYYYTVTYYYPDGTIAGTERVKGWLGDVDYTHINNQAQKYAQKYYEEQMAVPIGEPTTSLLLLMFAYLSYHEIKKRRHCKHFFLYFFL